MLVLIDCDSLRCTKWSPHYAQHLRHRHQSLGLSCPEGCGSERQAGSGSPVGAPVGTAAMRTFATLWRVS